jgi:hypothetical protein
VPIWLAPSNIKTVEEASAVPEIVGLLLLVTVPVAGLVITGAAGMAVSTVHVLLAGDVSKLPAPSLALTWSV